MLRTVKDLASMSKEYATGKETLRSEGYKYLYQDENGYHVLYEIATGNIERWSNHINAACYTLRYKNTELEFCSSFADYEKEKLFATMRRIQNWGEQHSDFHSTMMNVYRKYIAK